MQKPQPLAANSAVEEIKACHVAAGPGEAGDQTQLRPGRRRREDDRNRRGRRFGGKRTGVRPGVDDHGHLSANQIGRQLRQSIVLPQPSDIRSPRSGPRRSRFLQALTERRGRSRTDSSSDRPLKNPITGIAGCCARAASGQAAAAPPSSVMNSRRFIRSPRRRGRAASAARRGRALWRS